MYISKPLLLDLVSLPKNQARLFSQLVVSNDSNTNTGYISFKRTTPTQAQRIRKDMRRLVELGYVKKFPMSRATSDMKVTALLNSNCIKFYMVNPVHWHIKTVNREGLKDIWLILK